MKTHRNTKLCILLLNVGIIFPFYFTCALQLKAQENEKQEKKFKYNLYGYIAYDITADTYESKTTRNELFYFYPLKPDIHPVSGDDLNENFQLNMLSIQNRIGVKVSAPDFFNAKTSALVETDFMGTAEAYNYMLRLRLAYFSMKWEKATLLLGQYWHPLFTPECNPNTVCFGKSPAYNPLNRSGQARVDYTVNNAIKLIGTMSMNSYHKSVGPAKSQINAGVPDFQLQSHFTLGKILLGVGGGYFQLQPLLGDRGYKNKEKIHAFDAIVFGSATFNKVSVRLKSVIGQNLTHTLLTGGFGRIFDDQNNDSTFRYTSLITNANWIDCDYRLTKNISLGVFGGLTLNLGANKKITPIIDDPFFYANGTDIAYIIKIAPRVVYTVNNLVFALEYSNDRAAYTEEFDCYYRPKTINLQTGINNRVLFSAKYNFMGTPKRNS